VSSQINSDSAAPDRSQPGSFPAGRRPLKGIGTTLSRESAELSLSAFGVTFGIRADSRALLQDCLTYLPPGWKRQTSQSGDPLYSVTYRLKSGMGIRSTFSLAKNGREIVRCDDRTELLERLGSIVALHVADHCRKRVFLHAGVVGWGDRAIVIPGRSFSGKTTLVAELVRAGATYYSDEFAVVDRYGRVHPYPQPLQIRDSRTYRQARCPVETLGGVSGETPLPIGLVIFSRYKEGATWLPKELSPGVGCLQMLNNAVSARSAPAIALNALKHVASRAIIVRGTRGDASQLIQWITAHFNPLDSL
jgi:hypothetical protein